MRAFRPLFVGLLALALVGCDDDLFPPVRLAP
jgi:hypothetical protein